MNYAAAISDRSKLFYDDEQPTGVAVHPMFSVAITWPIIENLPQYLVAVDISLEVLLTQVHYTKYLMLHRQLRPDDELTIQGEMVAILPHRAGTHVVIQFQAFEKTGADFYRILWSGAEGGSMRGTRAERKKRSGDPRPRQ
jgi:hypothetical protein